MVQDTQHLNHLRQHDAHPIDILMQHSKALKKCIVLRLEAARKTRRIFDRTYEWSPTWKRLDNEVKLWRVAKQRFRRRVRGRFIRRLMKRANNHDCFTLNEDATILRYTAAKQAMEEFKPKASEYRKQHLKTLAKALADKNDTSEEAEFKKLTNQESQRKMGAKLKRTGTKPKKGLMAKVAHGPLDDPIWTEDKEGVENVSATENEERFTNCLKPSEFITDAGLLADVGILCDGPVVDDILEGHYEGPQHLHPHTKLVLEFMPKPEIIKANPMGKPKVTVEEHIKGWRKAKERTASEPSTLDFSH